MNEHDQALPLSPAPTHARKNLIKCCGGVTAVLLILSVVILILAFTVFRIKQPEIKMNRITIANTTIPTPGVNISMIVDVSIKNPNIASFKYNNTTTTIYYHGEVTGEGYGPPGNAKGQKTVRMNLTVEIMTDRVLNNPNLGMDVGSGVLNMTSYSRIGGRVNVLGVYKKDVMVTLNCSMGVNISSQAIKEQSCERKVDF